MALDRELRQLNRNMILFDLILGSGALLAPAQTLRVLGHDEPSADARELFRRNGAVWLTFAAAHLVAYRRNRARDPTAPPPHSGTSQRPPSPLGLDSTPGRGAASP